MTDPPKKRRRGLWIVLIAALGLGSGLGWWYWPRGDARFVGRWAFLEVGNPTADGVIVFNRNGVGHFAESQGLFTVSFRWRVEGDTLFLGSKSSGPLASRVEEFAELLFDWTGHSFLPEEVRHTIVTVAGSQIRLNEEDGTKYELNRIK